MLSILLTRLAASLQFIGVGGCEAARHNSAENPQGNWTVIRGSLIAMAAGLSAGSAYADTCRQLSASGLNDASLKSALQAVVPATGNPNGGLGFPMWLTLVDGSGIVCVVTNSLDGSSKNADVTADIWLGSRVISAQKANTANAFSLPALALSTANLYTATQPGGSLFGLQHSNPVDTDVAYRGNSILYGLQNDPMTGGKIGGVNVFGGGLALYDSKKTLLGAIGVSGDSSCADHNIAWRTRNNLKLDFVPGGVSGDATRPDNIVYDITPATGEMEGVSAKGWGHPKCSDDATKIAAGLPVISK